jgi:hypothetical protein
MPITIPHAPQDAVNALAGALPRLGSSPTIAASLPHASSAITQFIAARAANAAAGPALSLPVYVLGLSDVVGAGVGNAHHAGWAHVLPSSASARPVLVDTAVRANQHVFAAVTENATAADLRGRIAALQNDPVVAATAYDAALLKIPAMGLIAVWLRDAAKKNDLVVPLAPAPASVTAGHHYTVPQLLAAVGPIAHAKLARDAPTKGS